MSRGDLINSRTSEEIKKAVAQCHKGVCGGCVYFDCLSCERDMTKDILALIDRLESERDAALAKVPRWDSKEMEDSHEKAVYQRTDERPN